MRAIPSFTSSTVPTSRTSISARSAVWIFLRRISFSPPGRRMESVALGAPLGDCEFYHKNPERGSPERGTGDPTSVLLFRVPRSTFRVHTLDRRLPLQDRA